MSIKEIYDDITKQTQLASVKLDGCPPAIRNGMESKIRGATQRLAGLQDQYRREVIKNAVIIVVDGEFGQQFAEISAANHSTLSFDYMAVVDRISKNVINRGGRNGYGTQEHWMVMDELNQVKRDYNIVTLPQFVVKMNKFEANTDLYTGLKTRIFQNYGSQLNTAVLRGDISEAALAKEFTGKTLPVVVYNVKNQIDSGLLKEPYAILEIAEEPTKESVKKALMKIKKSLNPSKPKTKVEDPEKEQA